MLGKAVESVVRSRLGVRPRSRDPLTWVPSVRVRAPERGFEATQLKGRFYSPRKSRYTAVISTARTLIATNRKDGGTLILRVTT